MGQLDGKVAVITGGGRGIGKAIATRYAAEGATIVITSRTASDLEETLAAAGVSADRGLAVVADAMDRDDARRPVHEAIERFGRVDVVVNNVGGHTGGSGDPFKGNDAAFEQTLVLTLTTAWWTTSAALPSMREQGSGRIICIGSGASYRTGGSLPYTTAKHGLVGFVRQLAAETARHGINVNLLCPGTTQTSLLDLDAIAARSDRTPEQVEADLTADALQHRILDPSELGGMATLLAGPDGSGITGQVISVDAGYKV
jgi:NAD(P)-dependent dehydrogenase (short-subunit alcohol dehydrogenase family)